MLTIRSGLAATVNDATYSASALSPADATISVTFNSSGQVTISQNGGAPVNQYTWMNGGTAANYDIRATIVSGTVTTGTTGSWLSLSGGQSWSKTRTSNLAGTDTVVLTIEIRDASTLSVLDSGTVQLDAVVDV